MVLISSGGRFVQQSRTVRAVFVDGLCRNICVIFKILVSGFEDVV